MAPGGNSRGELPGICFRRKESRLPGVVEKGDSSVLILKRVLCPVGPGILVSAARYLIALLLPRVPRAELLPCLLPVGSCICLALSPHSEGC